MKKLFFIFSFVCALALFLPLFMGCSKADKNNSDDSNARNVRKFSLEYTIFMESDKKLRFTVSESKNGSLITMGFYAFVPDFEDEMELSSYSSSSYVLDGNAQFDECFAKLKQQIGDSGFMDLPQDKDAGTQMDGGKGRKLYVKLDGRKNEVTVSDKVPEPFALVEATVREFLLGNYSDNPNAREYLEAMQQ